MTNQSNGKLRMGMPGLEPLAEAAHLATLTKECSGNDLPGTIIALLVSLFIWQKALSRVRTDENEG
jgi:hypothetical protein